MTGSDKKEQKLASGESSLGGAQPLVVQDPDVSGFVMPGDPPGLIPRASLAAGVTTTITTWPQLPDPGDTETFRLQWARPGSNEWKLFQEHTFTGGGHLGAIGVHHTRQFLAGFGKRRPV